jgi:hypothetical protein
MGCRIDMRLVPVYRSHASVRGSPRHAVAGAPQDLAGSLFGQGGSLARRYNARMDRDSIRAFVDRDWNAVAESKTRYWADRFREEGWAAAWHASNALLLDVRLTRPDYPSDDDRALDGAAHLQLRRQLDRVADALTGC